MTTRLYTTFLSITLLLAFCRTSAVEIEGGIDLGYRNDTNQWTISGGEEGPNIISDLEWTDLEIVELQIEGELQYPNWAIRSALSFGTMIDGANRDSDYIYDDRQGEFSRSTADTEGSTFDFNIEAAYIIPLSDQGATLLPLIGFQYAAQYHEDSNGVQEIDRPDLEAILDGESTGLGPNDGDLGAFDGLNSTYDATWYGPHIGVELRLPFGKQSEFRTAARLHYFEYYAELYWNLRDLDFENEADGMGWSFDLQYLYNFSDQWRLLLEFNQTSFESNSGTQTDPEGDIDLNEAIWESYSLQAGIRYLF